MRTAAGAVALVMVATTMTQTDDRVQIRIENAPLVMADGVPAPPITAEIFGANARYPGGTVANFFDFTKAIGPVGQRGCQTSGGFATVRFGNLAGSRNGFGPDEEEALASTIGAQTMVMVPSINRTAQDAADYVEYMNSPSDGTATNPNGGVDWAEVRAANGHPAPYGIRTWEYGNEPFLDGQRYWRDEDQQTRVHQFIEGGWSRQKAADPTYQNDDGLFSGCDLVNRKTGTGLAGQTYRTRYNPIALPSDATAASGPIRCTRSGRPTARSASGTARMARSRRRGPP
ncbi:hypothetical protein ACXJJ3_38860 [Kribbella sp. WER1]